ncbi:MAG TPA: glycosyltransferase family 39 protein [Edaphobacter sp.]|nr:glycosyltransferase family 39 protein [Edaphobacter sp.]
MQSRRTYVTAGVCLLLLLFGLQIALTVHQESLTWDEGDHIFAGYMTWKTHDYGFNPEHPPLMKMLGALPLLASPLHVPPDQHRYFKAEAYMDGREMLFASGPEYAKTLTFRARMATGVVTILLGLLVFLTAQEMFGVWAAFVALVLLVFEPNVLAHGAFVATDAGVSCFFVASVYAFYRYCKVPSLGRLVVAGFSAGLALAAKHSAVLLLPMVVMLGGCEVAFRFNGEARGRRALRLVGGLAGIAVVAVVVLWAFYGFRYNARPDGLRLDPSLVDYVKPLRPVEAEGILYLARLHVLPESYLYGLADVRSMANGMPSYFFGKVYAHGIWYYFPTVLAIKSTLGFLGLVLLAIVAVATGRFRRWREILFLVVPAGVYLFVAMTSHLNIGARHILPVWVFLCLFAAGGASAWVWVEGRRSKGWGYAVAVLLVLHVASSARAYPNYMAYSNELWGGPAKTYRYLTDSNTDWAQQLIAVKQYTEEHGIKDCWFAYFADPFLRAEDYGIPCRPLPTPDSWFNKVQHPVPVTITGPVLISAGTLTGFEYGSNILNPYRGFQGLKPVTSIQDGVLVFEGTFQVPLASAMSFVQQSALLKEKDNAGALAAAQQAVGIAPGELLPQMVLGDALAAAGRKDEAREAYGRAMDVVKTMEPGGQEEWGAKVRAKVAGL